MTTDGLFVWRKKECQFSMKSEKKRQRERIAELDKTKRRREERAVERAQHEEKMALLARERARAEFHDLEKREREFDFHQSKLRSEIRLREGRAKPIDILIMTCYAANPPPPQASYIFKVFKGLTLEQREDLHNDIKQQMQYYEEMKDMDITTRRRYWEALLVVSQWELAEASMMKQMDGALLRGLHESIEEDVNSLLAGKTYVELEALQSQIESQMQSGAAKVVEYWEALLKCLHLYKAKAFLKENYNTQESESVHDDEQGLEEAQEEEEDGPVGALYDDEDKYCHQRRPKYLNRVHTGYEWNKYNRTHYDHDNPPPKKVQGYKFNIFYPDLIDQSRPPIYTVEKDDDAEDANTCIIRFRGGPPYQDIAFRIVNAEWDYSRKKGFKSTFEHGVLRLYFNFKRFSYRR